MNTIREDLKLYTKIFHESVEQSEGAKMLLSNELTIELYGQLLLRHYIFLRPIEEELQKMDWQNYDLNIKNHLRLPRLTRDLIHLNNSNILLTKIPNYPFLPRMNNNAQALGVLYVMEGSMMGGKFITKHIEKMFNEQHTSITQYFRGFDEQSMLTWSELCQCLDYAVHFDKNPINNTKEQIIIAACETFLLLEKCLNTPIFFQQVKKENPIAAIQL